MFSIRTPENYSTFMESIPHSESESISIDQVIMQPPEKKEPEAEVETKAEVDTKEEEEEQEE
jgi:hypothetical protein